MNDPQIEDAGTLPDGRQVQAVWLGAGRLRARVLTLGAIVQDLRLQGYDHPLVLGATDPTRYLTSHRYLGAIVGRVANRIANARFTIDGQTHHTDPNFLGRHTLHGGDDGPDLMLWTPLDVSRHSLSLALDLPDGHMGFPGNLSITAQISVLDKALQIDLSATSDAATPCSLTHHGYFDLDGRGDIRGHSLQIDADRMLPLDGDQIPTGQVSAVDGTEFDFRKARLLGDTRLDHNFCLSTAPRPLRPVATLEGQNGLRMQAQTTACGLQIYDGAHFQDLPGLDGRIYRAHAGLALETQHWPDAPNRPGFPDAILRPGQTYQEITQYRFLD